MMRALRKLATYGLGLGVLAIAVLAVVYASGVKLPVRSDTLAPVFPNWNKTNTVEADVSYSSEVWRAEGRTHLTVKLAMPEAVQRLKSFLDGGRTEIVACGPQKLFVHSLIDGTVGIEGDVITVDGMMDMELAGVINARDDMELFTAIRIGHDRTSVTAQVVELTLGQLPPPMIEAMLKQKSSVTYTREDVFARIARDMPPEDAAFLAKHQAALDPAIESVVPTSADGVFYLDAVISIDEGAALDAAVDRIAEAEAVTRVAEVLGPNQAQAQLLKNFVKALEKAGSKLTKELDSNPDLKNLLSDPNLSAGSLFSAFADCKVTF